MARLIRQSTTQSTAALWTTALLDTVVFLALAIVGPLWLASRLLPHEVPLWFGLRVAVATTLVLGGAILWAICVDAFVRRGRGTPLPLVAPRSLVTTGPFSVVRNPIIVADAAVVWGIALWASSVGGLLYAILFSVLGHCMVVYVEEPELQNRFGAAYRDYCKSVPRWFPAPW